MMPLLPEMATRHARAKGDSLAFAFLADGTEETRLTFAELDASARSIAAGLLRSARPGDRAILVYEAGLDFVAALLGCMHAGLVAVPVPAPESSRLQASIPRIESVIRDCSPSLLLGNARTHGLLRASRGELQGIPAQGWIDTCEFTGQSAAADFPPPDPDALAYLQYTSGSTTSPRGVMISHRNVVRHLAIMQEGLGYGPESVSVCWMPHFHDYGLIEGILLPLFNGTPSYLLSPFAFLKRPFSWLDTISRFRGTHTQAFNFAWRYCAKRVKPEQREQLDLSCLVSFGNGGEPIHPGTPEEFYQTFAAFGLKREALAPVFGLAEATLLVTAVPVTDAPVVTRLSAEALGRGEVVPFSGEKGGARSVVACGPPLPETEVVIVDPETLRRTEPNGVGEIWVSAPGVARGYWGRERESEETFRARIADENNGLTYLRTGDLGFIRDGQLHVSARRKDLIIVHGSNHYPQDIEWTVQQAHPLLRADNGAAFSIDVDGEEQLCVVQEIERGEISDDELSKIVEAVNQAIADRHGIRLHRFALIRRASIPKTTSGKIQRGACRLGLLAGSLKTVLDWPPSQESTMPDDTPPLKNSQSTRWADELIDWVRDYAERHINSRLIDERRCLPPNIVLDFGNRGLFGLQAPQRYGGLGLGVRDALRIYIQLAAIDPTIATLVFLHNTNGIRPILHHATPALRDELMPILARGRELAAFTLSEPGAGSNLGAVQARIVPDRDGLEGESWTIHGVKRWNGSAWTGVISVFARLLDAAGRPRGITGFVVRQSEPGVKIGPESLTMGIRGIIQNSVEFDGVRVTAERMLGEPGKGMQVVEDVLSHGRLATASVALGAAQRAAQLILRYTSRREVETGLLLENPQAGVLISEMVHRIGIDQQLLLDYGSMLDAGVPIVPEIAMAIKVSSTDTANFVTDLMIQLLGGRGYMENNLAPQLFRDTRMLSIGEGANESLIAAIGRSVRLTETVQKFLSQYSRGEHLAARLTSASQSLERRGEIGTYAGYSARAWHDAVRGRVAVAALGLAAAHETRQHEAIVWMQERLDRLCEEAERANPAIASLLSAEDIRRSIRVYAASIDDLEPQAPDVDYQLDPLLRRETPANHSAPLSESPDLERKREKLRKLLLQKDF